MTLFTQSFKHIAGVLFRNLKQLLRACKVEVLTLVCLQGRDWVNWMTREMKMRKLYLKQTTARDSQTDLKVRGFPVVLKCSRLTYQREITFLH